MFLCLVNWFVGNCVGIVLLLLMAPTRNPANLPVEVGSLSRYLQVFCTSQVVQDF